MAFWTMSDTLPSSQPSAIQAMDATIKIAKPATMTRAFQLAATNAAAMIVVTAAKVRRNTIASIVSPYKLIYSWARMTISSCDSSRSSLSRNERQ